MTQVVRASLARTAACELSHTVADTHTSKLSTSTRENAAAPQAVGLYTRTSFVHRVLLIASTGATSAALFR